MPEIPQPVVWLNKPSNFPLPRFKGKVTIIGFYTEDCSGCVIIQPTLLAIQKQYGQSVQILGVYTPFPHQKSSLAEIKLFLKEHKVLYPIIIDQKTEILRKFRVTRWPTLFVANAKGEIVSRIQGTQNIVNRAPSAVQKAKVSDD